MIDNIFELKHDSFYKAWVQPFHPESMIIIGGYPPDGIEPKYVNDHTKYLLTICLNKSEDKYLTLFHSFDYDADGETNPFDSSFTIFNDRSKLMQFCLHGFIRKGSNERLKSDIPKCSLLIDDQQCKEQLEISNIYEHHKLGGLPFFIGDSDQNIFQKYQVDIDDYIHVLQLAFPVGKKDMILDCDWPFGENVFHLFVNLESQSDSDFFAIWG